MAEYSDKYMMESLTGDSALRQISEIRKFKSKKVLLDFSNMRSVRSAGMILFLIIWIFLNLYLIDRVDPYPFVLLNLVLSCIAALQAPIIMMSQNREAKKDRLRSSNDYKTDLKSELILEDLHNKMSQIIKNQNKIINILTEEDNK